jgi:hypothetical protein
MRQLLTVAVAGLLVAFSVSDEAAARAARAGGARVGAGHGARVGVGHAGVARGGYYARGTAVRRGVGAAAVGAAAYGTYSTSQCGYSPYPPCY